VTKCQCALVVPNIQDILRWRQLLIRRLASCGIEVFVIAPANQACDRLSDIGCTTVTWNVRRHSLNPFSELRSFFALFRIYRRLKPDLVHHFTIKPNVYGALSARLAHVPVTVNSVTGLGFVWADSTLRTRLLRFFIRPLYRAVTRMATATIYMNAADRDTLGGQNTTTFPGEGVDLAAFRPQALSVNQREEYFRSLGLNEGKPTIMFVGRMLWQKGVGEFVEAARKIRDRIPGGNFVLVGPLDMHNPARIGPSVIRAWHDQGDVNYIGERTDIAEVMALADIVVLPSYYREGLPMVLIEAAALGKPLIATDVPGCRDIVIDGVNGILVPPKNSKALSVAIERLLFDEKLRSAFGEASRKIAEERFSTDKVVDMTTELYSKLLEAKGIEHRLKHRQQ
jgi:glycosyltransferase involved in cell wall biosynthesis